MLETRAAVAQEDLLAGGLDDANAVVAAVVREDRWRGLSLGATSVLSRFLLVASDDRLTSFERMS